MSETKFSLLRQFGSEQISVTVTLDKVAGDKDVEQALEALNLSIEKQFENVQDREIHEKKLLAMRSQERKDAIETLDSSLRAENLASAKLSKHAK